MRNQKSVTLAVAAAALSGFSIHAQQTPYAAYDNTEVAQKVGSDIIRVDGNGKEIGDEINLLGFTPTDTTTVVNFQFEYVYFGDPGATAVVRFYNLIDSGPNAGFIGSLIPGSVSNPFPLLNGHHSVNSGTISVTTPGRFVWAIEFQNVAPGVAVGMDLYQDAVNPSAGVGNGPNQSADNHWERPTGGTWTLQNDSLGIDNFGLKVVVIPEPSTYALLGAAALGLAALSRRRKA